MDRWGLKHVELIYVLNKLTHSKHFVYLVALHLYIKEIWLSLEAASVLSGVYFTAEHNGTYIAIQARPKWDDSSQIWGTCYIIYILTYDP